MDTRTASERRLVAARKQLRFVARASSPLSPFYVFTGQMALVVVGVALGYIPKQSNWQTPASWLLYSLAAAQAAVGIHVLILPELIKRRLKRKLIAQLQNPAAAAQRRPGHAWVPAAFRTPDRPALRSLHEFWCSYVMSLGQLHDELYAEADQGSYGLQGLVREASAAPFSVAWRGNKLDKLDLASEHLDRILASLDQVDRIEDPRLLAAITEICLHNAKYLLYQPENPRTDLAALDLLEALSQLAFLDGDADATDFALSALPNFIDKARCNTTTKTLPADLENLVSTTRRLFSHLAEVQA